MEQEIVHELNMLKGVSRFILENTITPPIARVTELTAGINNTIAIVEAAAGTQLGGTGEASGGVGTRREKAKALRGYLKDVARVGRSLDRETYPGVAETFVLPPTSGYAKLMASAAAMVARATPLEAEFVAHGLSATFLADIAALVAAFNAGSDDKVDGLMTQVGGTSTLRHRIAEGMEAAKKLDAIIRAHFRDDPVTLDVWTHARHVQRAPDRSSDEPEMPPGDPGSGTLAAAGSGEGAAGEGGAAV